MLTIQQARVIAETEINKMWQIPDDVPVIVESGTIELPSAWVFSWTSKHFLETGNMDYAIGGNAPLFVSKTDGRITIIGTAYDTEEMIRIYEERNSTIV